MGERCKRPQAGPLCRMDAPTHAHAHPPTQVARGSLVLDPFVGTGSILVPAAHLGAHTLGADIDVRVIKMGEGLGG